jgi:hypothetical protein
MGRMSESVQAQKGGEISRRDNGVISWKAK